VAVFLISVISGSLQQIATVMASLWPDEIIALPKREDAARNTVSVSLNKLTCSVDLRQGKFRESSLA